MAKSFLSDPQGKPRGGRGLAGADGARRDRLTGLDGVNEYMVQKDGFLAGAEGVKIESKMQSLTRGLLGGEGFLF